MSLEPVSTGVRSDPEAIVRRFRSKSAARTTLEAGFTLIELLVVVVIVGILIAIALPLYLNYQRGAANASAATDLRHAIVAIEKCRLDNGNYGPQVVEDHTVSWDPCTDVTASVSDGTTIHFIVSGGTPGAGTQWSATSVHSGGTKTYSYDSTVGGAIRVL